MEQEDLCLAIDEELAAFLRCVDNYETSSREVRYPAYNPVLKKHLTLKNSWASMHAQAEKSAFLLTLTKV